MKKQAETVGARAKLYQVKSFKEITLRDIAGATSFTKTSIYNLFSY